MSEKLFIVYVGIPPQYSEALKDAVSAAIKPIYPGYDRVFTEFPVKGTWRSLEGSDPYNGEIGKITVAEELRIEFAVKEDDLPAAVNAIRSVHPYEEPGITVIPMIGWKDLSLL